MGDMDRSLPPDNDAGQRPFSVSFRLLPCLLLSVLFLMLAGCRERETFLSPYPEEVAEVDALEIKADRIAGLTGDLCVIVDESSYDPSYLQAGAGALFDLKELRTVYAANALERLPMASLTKLMTAYVALKYGNLGRTVTLTNEVRVWDPQAWLCGLEPGDRIGAADLLRLALVYSGNDAANGLAVAVSGSVEAFVDLMNREAQAIGATSTHFANPNGLHAADHYSTVYDLYLIFHKCLEYPEFRQIIAMRSVEVSYSRPDGTQVTRTFTSGNSYFSDTAFPPEGITVVGGKTGHTPKAGYCLAMLARDPRGREYLGIILNADEKQQLYAQMNLLFDLALAEP